MDLARRTPICPRPPKPKKKYVEFLVDSTYIFSNLHLEKNVKFVKPAGIIRQFLMRSHTLILIFKLDISRKINCWNIDCYIFASFFFLGSCIWLIEKARASPKILSK